MPFSEQTITSRRQWSNNTFSFTITKPQGFDYKNGEFVMLGLRPAGKLITRAYSIVSSNQEAELEFLSIAVPNGPLTSHLSQLEVGQHILINSKTTGSLTLEHIRPGRNLYLLATGTGLAPFVSLVRAGEVFQHFDKVVLVHTTRTVAGLAYREELEARCDEHFYYFPTVTREDFQVQQRGAEMFRNGELFRQLDLPPADPEQDRLMLCGNPMMLKEMTAYLEEHGWSMSNYQGVGNFTVEQAFAMQDSEA